MADIKLINLPEKTTPDDTDIVIIQDTKTRRMTWSNLVKSIKDMLGNLASLTTNHKSTLVGAINELRANNSLLGGLKAEYVYIPEGVQRRFDIAPGSTMQLTISSNVDEMTYIIHVTRFLSTGLVKTVIRNHANFDFAVNPEKSAFFITPTYEARGMLFTISP